jgi:hypothetical protein
MNNDDDFDRGHRFRRLSADEMIDRIQDGHYEDDPPEDRPDWYVRGRARLKRRVEERANQDTRSPSPDTGRSGNR